MAKNYKNLCDRILAYRARHDISIAEFAVKCKISRQTIYFIECGLTKPTRLTLAKILAVLDNDN